MTQRITGSSAGKRRDFSIQLSTHEVSDESTGIPDLVTPNCCPAQLQPEVNSIGTLLQPNGWLVHKPWSAT